MKVYKGHIIYTKERQRFEVVENGYVAVDDEGRIVSVAADLKSLRAQTAGVAALGAQGADSNCIANPSVQVVDFGNRLIIPAMNDLHVHAAQYHNQGIAMDHELLPWLNEYTFPEESKFADLDYAERVYRRFVRALWQVGTMRAAIFATIHTPATRLLMELLQAAGIGALVGKVGMDRNCPEVLREPADDYVRGMEELVACSAPDGLVRPIVTPRFIPTCTPELLRACGETARRYGLPVQSHLSENTSEVAWVRELEPDSTGYGDAYRRYGLFGQVPTVMAHCVWSDADERQLMRDGGVVVAHCPTSNLNVASGMAPVRTFLDEGLRVGLGSDISGGHELSIFRMMVYAIQTSKMHYQRSNHRMAFLTLAEAFWMATKGGGSFFGRVGSFETGYDFDALVIDDGALYPDEYTVLQRLERFIYIGDDRQIAHRFCRGREVVLA